MAPLSPDPPGHPLPSAGEVKKKALSATTTLDPRSSNRNQRSAAFYCLDSRYSAA